MDVVSTAALHHQHVSHEGSIHDASTRDGLILRPRHWDRSASGFSPLHGQNMNRVENVVRYDDEESISPPSGP
jgi:hypothetical protein